jgi:outer membrane protein assembly factor BamB
MRRSSRLPVALAAGAVALAATAATATPHERPCRAGKTAPGGDWRGYGRDAAQSRNQADEHDLGPAAARTLAPAWTFDVASVGDTGQFDSTPVVAGGCVFAASTAGVVYALDAETGRLAWRHAVPVATAGLGGAIVSATIAVHDLVVVVVNEAGDGTTGPYLLALDAGSGAVAWRSAPMSREPGYYSNASPAEYGGLVVAGFSPPEGQQTGQGGFVIVDARDGTTLRTTPTIPPADQAKGYSGGGLWSTAAFDTATGYAYLGGGNPFSHTVEHEHTNAILKVDARRGSPAFGAIVASYKGNADQYTGALTTLAHTPVCDATAPVDFPLDDTACGQLDLDFGATPNVFHAGGHTYVGDLQKAGVYHVADAATMAPAWSTIVGASCAVCNAASTAVDGTGVYGVGTPGGAAFALDQADGGRRWTVPVGDGAHYESTSVANGVVYTVDGTGGFLAFDAASGTPLLHRSVTADTGHAAGGLTSNGVAIAYHTVFVAADTTVPTAGGTADDGVILAYRPA